MLGIVVVVWSGVRKEPMSVPCTSKIGAAAIMFMFIKLEVKKATRVDLTMQ